MGAWEGRSRAGGGTGSSTSVLAPAVGLFVAENWRKEEEEEGGGESSIRGSAVWFGVGAVHLQQSANRINDMGPGVTLGSRAAV